jgi:hypothetical protein
MSRPEPCDLLVSIYWFATYYFVDIFMYVFFVFVFYRDDYCFEDPPFFLFVSLILSTTPPAWTPGRQGYFEFRCTGGGGGSVPPSFGCRWHAS